MPELPRGLIPLTDIREKKGTRFQMGTTPQMIKHKKKSKQPNSFEEYIAQLPDWKKVLLNTFMEKNNDYKNLDTHLKIGTTLWFVTDGEVTGLIGYFGWVIATSIHILWEGRGHSEGNPELMESLRLERTGLLALEQQNIYITAITIHFKKAWQDTVKNKKKK
eukprot:3878748-Ditylum_brightwellii.AAC.1